MTEIRDVINVDVINVLNQPKTATLSIMDLGKQLLECAKDGRTSKVHDLMCRGAPFTTDWLGKSALHMAAENNHYETCEVLLKAGISKDSRTKVERTPIHLAVCNGHVKIVKLLLQQKCDVNAKDMIKYTPLHWAVEEDQPDIVRLLLRYGANPHAEAKDDHTPISLARQRKFDDIYHILSTYKYQPCVSIQEQQEATDSLMQEMEKDSLSSFKQSDVDISQDSISCDNTTRTATPTTIHGNLTNSAARQHNSPTLQLLQEELSVDDTNHFLQSAYACGRQIVVTEFGKQLLKVQNTNANSMTKHTTVAAPATTTSNSMAQIAQMASKNGDIKQKPVGILIANSTMTTSTPPKVLTKPNIVKRITPEEWTKLCGEGKIKTVASPNVLTTANGIRFQKCCVMPKVNVNNDASNVPTAATVKVINKPAITNNSIGPTAKKVLIKNEPPQLTNFTAAKFNKALPLPMATESSETKMVQIPLPDYAQLVAEMKELRARVATLEEHCEKCTGFIRHKFTTQH